MKFVSFAYKHKTRILLDRWRYYSFGRTKDDCMFLVSIDVVLCSIVHPQSGDGIAVELFVSKAHRDRVSDPRFGL